MKRGRSVYLASGSPRRIKLLKEWGLKFTVIRSGVSERSILKKPSALVKALALRKAEKVAKIVKDGVVIGADTVVVIKGEIIGKPADNDHSKDILSKLSGSSHAVYTGVAVIDAKNGKKDVRYEKSIVRMRKLHPEEIHSMSRKHLDKAGAYAIQENDDRFVEKITGDYYNVVGLPHMLTKQMLKKFGVLIK